MTHRLAFVDTETTGLDPNRHEPWEVAVLSCPVDALDDVDVWHALLPVDLARADATALRIGSYYQRRRGKQMAAPRTAAGRLAYLLDGVTLVGCNPAFDAQMLDGFLRRHGQAPTWLHRMIDLPSMTFGFLYADAAAWDDDASVRPQPPYRSDDLAAAVGVEPCSDDDRHTALGDARWCHRWYRQLVNPT